MKLKAKKSTYIRVVFDDHQEHTHLDEGHTINIPIDDFEVVDECRHIGIIDKAMCSKCNYRRSEMRNDYKESNHPKLKPENNLDDLIKSMQGLAVTEYRQSLIKKLEGMRVDDLIRRTSDGSATNQKFGYNQAISDIRQLLKGEDQ